MSKLKAKKWTLLYTEISKLGEGGNADVYLVEDSRSGKRYALKELRSSNRSEEKKSRFVSEIQIARDNRLFYGRLLVYNADCTADNGLRKWNVS